MLFIFNENLHYLLLLVLNFLLLFFIKIVRLFYFYDLLLKPRLTLIFIRVKELKFMNIIRQTKDYILLNRYNIARKAHFIHEVLSQTLVERYLDSLTI